jgi:hypothetical protein
MILAAVGLWGYFFGQVFVHPGVLAFRDTAHYYYPLLRFVTQLWSRGEVPLWNPYDHLGTPLLADPTSLALYPGLLLLWLGRSLGEGLNWFILFHFGLAFWGSWGLARRWGADLAGSVLAATSYTFGGIVLFQYANLVYLVGASWLPVAVWVFDRAVSFPRPAYVVQAGLVLACVVLGGDFQTAYHIVLLWTGYLLTVGRRLIPPCPGGRWLSSHSDSPPNERSERLPLAPTLVPSADFPEVRGLVSPWQCFWIALAVGVGISAPVWIPATEFALWSDRQITREPRTLYEWMFWLLSRRSDDSTGTLLPPLGALLGRTEPGTHHHAVFDFSIPPSRWGEFLWPNFAGRFFPENRRWLASLGGEDRLWTPSLYMGLVPFLLALMAFCLLGASDQRVHWLSWLFVLGLVGSLGIYGLGYVIAELLRLFGRLPEEGLTVGPAFGGLYWLMTVLLPGYVGFRYPAKLLTLVAFAISQLAAQGWNVAVDSARQAARVCFLTVGLFTAILAAALVSNREVLAQWFRQGLADPAFGPLAVQGAWQDLVGAFVQTTLVAGLAWLVLRFPNRFGPYLLVVLTCVDLGTAHRWMVVTLDEPELTAEPSVARVLRQSLFAGKSLLEPANHEPPILRLYRMPVEVAPSWCQFGSARRLTEMTAWQRDSLFSKFHLMLPVGSLAPGNSARLADWQFVLWICQAAAQVPSEELGAPGNSQSEGLSSPTGEQEGPGAAPTARILIPPGADFVLLPVGYVPSGFVPVVGQEALSVPTGLVLWRRVELQPIAWFAEELEVLPALTSSNPRAVWRRTLDVLLPGGRPRDFRQSCVLEVPARDLRHFGNKVHTEAESKWKSRELAANKSDSISAILEYDRKHGNYTAVFGEWQRLTAAIDGGSFIKYGEKVSLMANSELGRFEFPSQTVATTFVTGTEKSGNVGLEEIPQCVLVKLMPTRLCFRIDAPKSGIVVIASQYYPGWRASLQPIAGDKSSWLPCPIWRANRVMVAVGVPPGQWLLTLSYRSWGFEVGLALCLVTGISVLAWLVVWVLRQAEELRSHLLTGEIALFFPRSRDLSGLPRPMSDDLPSN